MKRGYLLILLVMGFTSFAPGVWADDLTDRTGVGIGYLYISMKHGHSSKISYEGLICDVLGEVGIGGRVYYNITPQEKMVWYIGGGGYISSKKDGIGLGLSGFGGGEYFVNEDFTVGGDIGPIFSTGTDSMGLDLKFGIHYYFK